MTVDGAGQTFGSVAVRDEGVPDDSRRHRARLGPSAPL
jgi:hypothetical protein